MDTPHAAVTHLRKIRSFVRRPGRATAAQRRALAELLPRFGVTATGPNPLDLEALFGRRARRVLDIGFGDGEALVTNALNNPGVDYLGVEVHEPGVGHMLLLLEKTGAKNVRVVVHDATEVVPLLPDGGFAAVDVLFPDPWPKKRHHKRRLVQPPFVAELARVLEPKGVLHVATDWADYARHTGEVLAASASFAPVAGAELHAEPLAVRPPTKFERRGVRLGHEVADLYYRRR